MSKKDNCDVTVLFWTLVTILDTDLANLSRPTTYQLQKVMGLSTLLKGHRLFFINSGQLTLDSDFLHFTLLTLSTLGHITYLIEVYL